MLVSDDPETRNEKRQEPTQEPTKQSCSDSIPNPRPLPAPGVGQYKAGAATPNTLADTHWLSCCCAAGDLWMASQVKVTLSVGASTAEQVCAISTERLIPACDPSLIFSAGRILQIL